MRVVLGVLAAMAAGGAASAETSGVTVVFEGLRSRTGAVEVALFDAEASYAKTQSPAKRARAAVKGRSVEVRFEGLAPGRYGVMAFHDVNGDGKLNTNAVRMPMEPYGFSNNVRGRLGPAPWKAASFQAGPGETRQVITLK